LAARRAACYELAADGSLVPHLSPGLANGGGGGGAAGADAAYRACCYGHFEDDRAFSDASLAGWAVPTNGAMLALLDPAVPPREPYGVMYHHFRWPHCTGGDGANLKAFDDGA
jgi:hypothetical protein